MDRQVDVNRVIEIIREENPMVLELAMRRAFIEQQAEIIERLQLTQELPA